MSCYMSSKDREKAIFEYIEQLETELAEVKKEIKRVYSLNDGFSDQVMGLNSELSQLREENEWISVEEFKKEPTAHCWIKYKGSIKLAHYGVYNTEIFKFSQYDNGNYMTECIAAVMPITPPQE